MSLDTKKMLSMGLLALSVLSWILRRAGFLYIPGLTAFTLAAAMLIFGTATLSSNRQKKIFPVLIIAFGLLNIVVGALEIYSYIKG